MNQQHTQIKEIFLTVIELNPDEIQSYITSATNDPHVIKQVLELVETYQNNTKYTQDFVHDIAENISNSPLLFPSERYTLIEKIGQGGMGDVYLAQRKIKDIKQKVAIKILHLSDNLSKSRFSQETRILSQLSHPNISQFIDADFLTDSRPYVVMEYTQGQRITDYCKDKSIDIKKRISLFLSLCEAVQHAHRNLIIHRDIKPDNVLVTDSAELKLLDFGIAKIIQDQNDSKTKTHMHAMTPAYASPEQVAGKTVTVSSDVYSLGVLLYELLSGMRPYEPKNYSPIEFEKLLRDTTPLKPSVKLTQNPTAISSTDNPQRWINTVSGDLDKIVLKALQFDVSQRYQTVAELINDLDRYKSNRPVLAQTPSFTYKLNKFIKRNKLLVSSAMTVIACITVFLTIVLRQNDSIKKQADELLVQRDEAQREQKRAASLSDTFIQAFKNADLTKTQGKEITASQILQETVNLIQSRQLKDPELKSQLIIMIAEVYRHISKHKEAKNLIESINPNISTLSLESKNRVLFEKAMNLSHFDQMPKAIKILEKIKPSAKEKNYILTGLARLYAKNGEDKKAIFLLTDLYKNTKDDDPYYSSICENFAMVQTYMGLKKEGEKTYQECLANIDKYSEKFTDWDKSRIYVQLGHIANYRNDSNLAKEYYQKAFDINVKIFGEDSFNISKDYTNMAVMLSKEGKYAESIVLHKKIIDAFIKHYGPQHTQIAYAYTRIAAPYSKLKDYKSAEKYYLQAIDIFKKNGFAKHKNIAFFYDNLAKVYLKTKQYDLVIDALINASEMYALPAFIEGIRYIDTQILLSQIYLKTGDRKRAKEIFEKSYSLVLEKYEPENDPLDKITWDRAAELSKVFSDK